MHPKFQRNRPSNYRVILIVTKLTPLRFARDTYVHYGSPTSTIDQYVLGRRDEATLLKRPPVNRSSGCEDISMGKASPRPLMLFCLLFYERLCSLAALVTSRKDVVITGVTKLTRAKNVTPEHVIQFSFLAKYLNELFEIYRYGLAELGRCKSIFKTTFLARFMSESVVLV